MPERFPHVADSLTENDQLVLGEFGLDRRLFSLKPRQNSVKLFASVVLPGEPFRPLDVRAERTAVESVLDWGYVLSLSRNFFLRCQAR